MKRHSSSRATMLLKMLTALALSLFVAGAAAAAAPAADPSELATLGFKTLVATTPVQQEWVRSLAPGKIKPVQRNGKKFFIYPDASRNQIYVGGPQEYAAYLEQHPEGRPPSAEESASKASAYRGKQDAAMKQATARDLTDPFLGASWADLGW
jgi:hypothetical protein